MQRPVTTTKIRNGVIAKQTVTLQQIASIVTAAAENGHETESVSLTLLICAKSARDLVVYVLTEETVEEVRASFHSSTKTDSCMTVCNSISRPGVRRQLIITRTRDGDTVFLSVSLNCCLVFFSNLSGVQIHHLDERTDVLSEYHSMRFSKPPFYKQTVNTAELAKLNIDCKRREREVRELPIY